MTQKADFMGHALGGTPQAHTLLLPPAPTQVIGCGDSGIDLDDCYFYDPAMPVRGNVYVDSNGMQVGRLEGVGCVAVGSRVWMEGLRCVAVGSRVCGCRV